MVGFLGGTEGKESRKHRRRGFDPWIRKIPWRRKWQPTPVFLPGKFHGQRSLAGYSPWGHKESDMTECLTLFFFFLFLSNTSNMVYLFMTENFIIMYFKVIPFPI